MSDAALAFPSVLDQPLADPVPELPRFVDSTMISCFRSCPQKFYNEFVLGLRPVALSRDLHAGACFANAMEAFYRATWLQKANHEEALRAAFRVYLRSWGNFPFDDGTSSKSFENVWAAFESYFETYPPLTDYVQPYFDTSGAPTFEFTFAIPLENDKVNQHSDSWPLHPSGDPFIYSGRFDMLGNYNGLPVIRDEKTTKSIGQSWPDQWDLRSQFIGYTWAAREYGLDIDTVVIRGIGILKSKISHAEAIKTYSNDLRARWLEQVRRDLWRLRKCWDEGYWDWNLAEACSSYGGCAFRTLCTSSHPENWYSTYTQRRWNPLHVNPLNGGEAKP